MSYKYDKEQETSWVVCEPIAGYSRVSAKRAKQLSLFKDELPKSEEHDIRIVELFAKVGGFRIGFERASRQFKTVWNNQWEPSTKCVCFGISTIKSLTK